MKKTKQFIIRRPDLKLNLGCTMPFKFNKDMGMYYMWLGRDLLVFTKDD